jgi:hypothetical protein
VKLLPHKKSFGIYHFNTYVYNIAEEARGTGMYVERILVGYIIMFLLPTLNSEGTVGGRACAYLYSGSGYTF